VRKGWIKLGDPNEIRPRRILAKRQAVKSCRPLRGKLFAPEARNCLRLSVLPPALIAPEERLIRELRLRSMEFVIPRAVISEGLNMRVPDREQYRCSENDKFQTWFCDLRTWTSRLKSWRIQNLREQRSVLPILIELSSSLRTYHYLHLIRPDTIRYYNLLQFKSPDNRSKQNENNSQALNTCRCSCQAHTNVCTECFVHTLKKYWRS